MKPFLSRTSFQCFLALTLSVCFLHTAAAEKDEITDHYRRMMIYHEYMDGNVPEGAVLFIGDSITQGLCVSAVSPLAVNYGIGSDTTVGVLKRLPKYQSMQRCSAIVFAIGVNDLARRDNKEIVNNWKQIMDALPTDSRAVFSAILPMDAALERISEKSLQRIGELNASLQELCEEQEFIFANAGPLLTNEAGNLDPAFHTGDGVHLNTAGYGKWIAVLQEALEKLPEK